MFEKIVTLEEHIAANLDPRPHMVAALKAIATRVEDIGKTADGAVAEQVKAIEERLSSLTSAVTGMGDLFTSLQGLLTQAMTRMDQIEAAQKAAPAAPPVPPQA